MTKFRTALLFLSLAISGAAAAQGLLGPASNEDQFLPVDQAFVLTAIADGGDTVLLDWQIAPGYYLYRHRISVKTATPGFSLGDIALPDGKKKTDEFFGDVEVYYDVLGAKLPVVRTGGTSSFELAVSYQGCADAGLCYPPVTKTVSIEMPPPGTPPASDAPPMVSEQDRLSTLIAGGSLFAIMASFFGFGLLLAFTPCVLPMIPILSGIIAGQGEAATPRRSFLLSLVYVLGMALTYTIAGAAFAAAGQQAQAFFQQPWIIISFAALFVVLALAMFGLFDIKVPCRAGDQARKPVGAPEIRKLRRHGDDGCAIRARRNRLRRAADGRGARGDRPDRATSCAAPWHSSPWRSAWARRSCSWESRAAASSRMPGSG